MYEISYPSSWNDLSSPSMRYELMLVLHEIIEQRNCEIIEQSSDFILDDISYRDRKNGVVGGCIFIDEENLFLAFLCEYESCVEECKKHSTTAVKIESLISHTKSLLVLMEKRGLPRSE